MRPFYFLRFLFVQAGSVDGLVASIAGNPLAK
jgi:hypothetical protein